jgi:undecaprenyl-diphosphatase
VPFLSRFGLTMQQAVGTSGACGLPIAIAGALGFIKTAIIIGLIQCLALIPGTSRSGSTIIGSLFLGVSRKASAEYSFFLGIPVLVGAGLLDLTKNHHILTTTEDWTIMAVGVVVSFIFAMIFIKWLVNWVSTRDFTLFAWWRIVVGVLVLIAGMLGYI